MFNVYLQCTMWWPTQTAAVTKNRLLLLNPKKAFWLEVFGRWYQVLQLIVRTSFLGVGHPTHNCPFKWRLGGYQTAATAFWYAKLILIYANYWPLSPARSCALFILFCQLPGGKILLWSTSIWPLSSSTHMPSTAVLVDVLAMDTSVVDASAASADSPLVGVDSRSW